MTVLTNQQSSDSREWPHMSVRRYYWTNLWKEKAHKTKTIPFAETR